MVEFCNFTIKHWKNNKAHRIVIYILDNHYTHSDWDYGIFELPAVISNFITFNRETCCAKREMWVLKDNTRVVAMKNI